VKTLDAIKTIRGRGGVHVALVTSAAKAAYDSAFYCLRGTGTLMVVGLPAENIAFPAIMMAAGEVRIQASAVGTRKDVRDTLAMAAAGKLHCHVATRPLIEANEVLEDLRNGQITGRVVLTV
jgi:propanol-preferring alcohol dehydrogenase